MRLPQLLDMSVVQRLAEANYHANGMPTGIIDALDGTILTGCGWQDICLKFHRAHPRSRQRCEQSDGHIRSHLSETAAFEYTCQNGLRDIGIPIVAGGQHLATLFLGQFFYEGESPDRERFVRQGREFGYDEQAYLAALERVPIFSRRLVENIIGYNRALARFIADLAEGALRHIRDRETLEKTEEQYRSLFESSADAILAIDLEGHFTAANPAAMRMLGCTREELLTQTYLEVTPARWHEMNLAIVRQEVPARGYADEYEKEYVRKDGTVIPVAIRTFLRTDLAGRPSGAWAIVRDRTESRRSQEALSRSEARFRALIEKSSDMILVLDEDARIQFWSPSATEALGFTAEEVLGRSRYDFVHPDDRPRLAAAIGSILTKGAGASAGLTMRVLHKDGSWRLIQSEARNLLTDPAVLGIVVNCRDITEQRRLEEQFQQAQKLESVGRLAGGVAHDFNNLLTVILASADVLLSDLQAGVAPRLEDVEDIAAAGRRASELTRQLLAFARRQVIAPVPLDLNVLLRGSEKLLRRVLGEDIELAVRFEPDLWPVRCDPGQLEQVVLNLAVNARDAMPKGGRLTIETANLVVDEALTASNPWMSPGPYARLKVRDSGHGMSPEVKAHVFEPFFTTKPVGSGTGLGLATVYGIVKQGGGYILVDSAPGQGTTFELFFPRIAGVAPLATALPAATSVGGTETILVVEDDPQVREVVVRSLRAGGYRVLPARDGREALELGAREPERIDLLLTDVVMPGLDGRAVADELRRGRPGLRALFMSGYTQDAIVRRGVLDDGIEYLPKPFTHSTLLERVRSVLDRK